MMIEVIYAGAGALIGGIIVGRVRAGRYNKMVWHSRRAATSRDQAIIAWHRAEDELARHRGTDNILEAQRDSARRAHANAAKRAQELDEQIVHLRGEFHDKSNQLVAAIDLQGSALGLARSMILSREQMTDEAKSFIDGAIGIGQDALDAMKPALAVVPDHD